MSSEFEQFDGESSYPAGYPSDEGQQEPQHTYAEPTYSVPDHDAPPDEAMIQPEPVELAPNFVQTPPRRRRRLKLPKPTDWLVYLLLILVMASGAYFRFVGQNWDDETHLHPDERFLTGVALSIDTGSINRQDNVDGDTTTPEQRTAICKERYPNPDNPDKSGVGGIFDSMCSDWFPRNTGNGLYVYGELPLFIVRIAGETIAALPVSFAKYALTYEGIQLVGRSMSAIADIISILFIFLIGRRLFNKWTGLLAAALYAASAFPIQLSHYWTTDAFTNLPVVISFWFAVRVMDRAKWYDFVGFGVAFGAAVASRVNVLPLFGVVVLAAIIYALPVFDIDVAGNSQRTRGLWGIIKQVGHVFVLLFTSSIPTSFSRRQNEYVAGLGSEQRRIVSRLFVNLVFCAAFSLLAFRIFNPHAFTGGPGVTGFFNIIPYKPWLANIAEAQRLTSGTEDFPPAYQWSGRAPYLFPLHNIVLYGLGLPLGLIACIATILATIWILRSRRGWTRLALPIAWVGVYFGFLGKSWVSTMRYFMPIYPFLALLGAWLLIEAVRVAWKAGREHPTMVRRVAFVGGTILLIVVLGGTYLYGYMFTSIYRRQLTRVEASRWVQRNIPSIFSTTMTANDGRVRMINWATYGTLPANTDKSLPTDAPAVIAFVPSVNGSVDHLTISHLRKVGDAAQVTCTFKISSNSDGSAPLATAVAKIDFSSGNDQTSVVAPLDAPLTVTQNEQAYLVTQCDNNITLVNDLSTQVADIILAGPDLNNAATISVPAQPMFDQGSAAVSFNNSPVQSEFVAPLDGKIDHIDVPHLLGFQTMTVNVKLLDTKTQNTLAEGKLTVTPTSRKTSQSGDAYSIPLNAPLALKAEQHVTFQVSTDGPPAQATGTIISNEGGWDDPIPWKVCPIPDDVELTHDTPSGYGTPDCQGIDAFGGWYRGVDGAMASEDDPSKRDAIVTTLNQGDYYIISSNRFYDSEARMPIRFPMSIKFYDALFAGKLGFTLIKTVTSFPSIGDFQIPDQYLPTDTGPKWLNEWESEEAFSVYDHPTVFIFKKNADYNSKSLQAFLDSVVVTDAGEAVGSGENTTLVNRVKWSSLDAGSAPSGFQLSPEQQAIQTQGGTFSDLFPRDSFLNTNQVAAVIVWWLTIMLFGWITWPLLFTIMPGLPDRAYPIAKLAGMLIVAWIAWALGTLGFLTWSSAGLALIMLGLAIVSLIMGFRRRAELLEYIRLNWRHFVVVELITLALFVAFLLVRLGNPDLWAEVLGGEKPMDFAYLNAVLRSTIFPPYDAWYAGGYINYYYFGFVLVGTPVKLLGIMPSIAYNLILPTLFACTGIGAFSVAFNITTSRWFFPHDEGDESVNASGQARRRFALRLPPASPYIAGILALLMCAVFGNLDTPRVFLGAVANQGGYNENACLPAPDPNAPPVLPGEPQAAPSIGQSLCNTVQYLGAVSRGLQVIAQGSTIPVGSDRWFWGPRSVVGELPNSSNEINEMPYFTFVFADLHAHMIAMPMTLLVLLWLVAEVLGAGRTGKDGEPLRRPLEFVIAAIFGGLGVGVLFATNSWDWLTYTVLALPTFAFIMYLRPGKLSRRKVVTWIAQTVIFLIAWYIAAIPFKAYFATAYTSAQPFINQKTPLWAYLDIHGLFLFIIISLLVWQTVRLLTRVYVRDFIGRRWAFLLVFLSILFTVALTFLMSLLPLQTSFLVLPVPISVVCLPLLAWCAILFLVPDQTREMRILCVLTALAIGVSYGVEFVVLGGDIGRQNTFFKFYIQAWILFSVVSGVALAWLLQASSRWSLVVRIPWLTVTAILLIMAALFPIMATQGKIAMRMADDAPHTLDGDAYMAYATYSEGNTWNQQNVSFKLDTDLDIIHWLQDNVKGTPVIMEAQMVEYRLGSRISINTGLPTVVGWNFHQRQQRTIDPLPRLVENRVGNVQGFYNTPDIQTAWNMLKFYNVQYIIVGQLEKAVYKPEGIAKFDQMVDKKLIQVVYQDNIGDKIYQIIPGAVLDTQSALAGGQ